MHTVKKNWDCPTLLEFNDWLKDKSEAHERMKLSSGKPKIENSNLPANVLRTRTGTKVFASTSSRQTPSMGDKDNQLTNCIPCKEKHPDGAVWCFAIKRLHNGQNWLQTTNSVFRS